MGTLQFYIPGLAWQKIATFNIIQTFFSNLLNQSLTVYLFRCICKVEMNFKDAIPIFSSMLTNEFNCKLMKVLTLRNESNKPNFAEHATDTTLLCGEF